MDVRGKQVLVTGGAGFIGSHAVEALLEAGAKVRVLDNLSAGRADFLANVMDRIAFVEGDAGDPATLDRVLDGVDSVWHLAADPEVRSGERDPAGLYEANVAMTFRLLEAMRRAGVRHLAFTSTSTVYGEATVLPTPEDYGPLLPISVYGGCKLACEGLIASYAGTFGMDALLFRFANVVGPRSTHGVTYDFVGKLRANPEVLEILGDGTQTKSYVSVRDTVAGMMHAVHHAPRGCHAYNVGSLDAIPVTTIADVVANVMKLSPQYRFTGGTRGGAGWTGDVKNMGLDVARLTALGPGWKPAMDSSAAVQEAAAWLVDRHLKDD